MNHLSSDQSTTMGCTENTKCRVATDAAGTLVGRDLYGREISACHECCSTDKCNKNLCAHLKPSACLDDVKMDCPLLDTVINICHDIHHAKTVCPKFCGLCSLVDGNWASWSQLSQCDVTCGNGTQTRTRTCTNPAPANGGLDCSGTNSDTKTCLKDPCPIHGGWTKWSNWESCSVTCGTGLARRHRNCSNVQCATPNIVFSAKNLVTRSPTNDQTMIFSSTLLNEGHAYNTSTGMFTSPVNGTFSFSTQLCIISNKYLYIAIEVDGVRYATASLYDKDRDICNTAVAVALLHVNSKVCVKCTYATGEEVIFQGPCRLNSFSGYLIKLA